MRKSFSKFALVAILGFTMAFALSCSSDDGGYISSSSTTANMETYYDVVLGNLSTNCPNINLYPELLNSVMPVTDTWIDIARNCITNRQDYYSQTSSQVTSFLNTNNLDDYINDFNQKIPMSPYYEGILIYTNTSGYYRVLVIGYSGYNRTPSASSSSMKVVSSSSKTTVSSSSIGTTSTCDLNCASKAESDAVASGTLYSGAFCTKVASCGTGCKARYSQCGSSNTVEKTKCGTTSYDATNTNLRCENGVVETKCGTNGWYNASNTNLKCLNNIVKTRCGTDGWYDTTDVNLRCENGVVEAKCGISWYKTTNFGCENNVIKPKCGANGLYDVSTQYCSQGTVKDYVLFVDYEGKTYKAVKIGTQTWMAENLNYEVEGGKCYGEGGQVYTGSEYITLSTSEIQANCLVYGRLYNWATAMALPASCNSNSCSEQIDSKHRGICPSDWHIPSREEWATLIKVVGDFSSLRTTSGWSGGSLRGNGTDKYGFSALPSGGGVPDGYDSPFGVIVNGYFGGIGNNGYWQSATEDEAKARILSGDGSITLEDKTRFNSIRCVKD